ncbi:MAG: Lrp/AsnC family transcriptional regulator [Saprospiraceae bacterium]|nr:Lrp/AsnC family transcriptional regulator [Saprospiraceae bacterium]
MPKARLDKIDLEILMLLQQHGRMTIKDVALGLGMTTTPIFERIKRLERNGVIKGYAALLDPQLVDMQLTAFIHLSLVNHARKALEKFIADISIFPEVMEVHHVSGDEDFLIKVVVKDMGHYNLFVLRKLSKVPNVGKVRSSFSLSTYKSTTVFPVAPPR